MANAADSTAGRGGRGGGRGGRGGGAGGAAATVAAAVVRSGSRRGPRVPARPAADAAERRRSRPGAAAASRASGTAAFRFRRTRSRTSRAATTPTIMETGVLSGLQLTSMFPQLVLENFYIKTRNSLEAGAATGAVRLRLPRPARHDEGRDAHQHPARPGDRGRQAQSAPVRSGTETFPAGSYLVKLNQPYGRLAKNLLEKQDYPDPALTTYDDSGWSMGLAFNVDVREIKDSTILAANAPLITTADVKGTVAGQRHRRTRGRALRLEQHDHLPLPSEGGEDEDRGSVVHGRGRHFPRRLVHRHRHAGGYCRPRGRRSRRSV